MLSWCRCKFGPVQYLTCYIYIYIYKIEAHTSSRHSGNSEVAPFPSFYRRENAVKTPTTKEFRKSSADQTSSEDDDDDSAHHGKVQYAPMPEHRKLGYFSTSALIVSKMIGTGVFAKPSTVFGFVGGKGLALFLWVACGLMSLAGYVGFSLS